MVEMRGGGLEAPATLPGRSAARSPRSHGRLGARQAAEKPVSQKRPELCGARTRGKVLHLPPFFRILTLDFLLDQEVEMREGAGSSSDSARPKCREISTVPRKARSQAGCRKARLPERT